MAGQTEDFQGVELGEVSDGAAGLEGKKADTLDIKVETAGFEPPPFDSIEEAEANQATTEDLNRGGKLLRKMGFQGCFRRPVVQPKKGEALESITLQVPFTKKFYAKTKKTVKRRTNEVITSKYTMWSFLPVAISRQFRRYTNAFYLVIAVLALAGYYGNNLWIVSFNPVTIIILLAVVIGFALIFEAKDDISRHRRDAETNNARINRIRNSKLEETTWGELLPGDFIVVNDRESVPADIVLLASYGADKKGSTCYIETSGIDGETNLKIKEVPHFMTERLMSNIEIKDSCSSARSSRAELKRQSSTLDFMNSKKTTFAAFIPKVASGTYEFEQPNVFLQFNASFVPFNSRDGSVKHPIDFRNLILRGSTLRNTKWIFGMVAYAGPETKLALSKRKSPDKLGRIDIFLNKILIGITFLYLVLVALADLLLFVVAPDTSKWWYFRYTSSTDTFEVPGPVAYLFTFAILFANIIPIPILICVEVMNFYAQQMLQLDINLYHKDSDSRAVCQSGNLVAEIGQISHVFSDKTGTLTRNRMKMIGCYVNSTMYGFVPPVVDSTNSGSDISPLSDLDAEVQPTTSTGTSSPPPAQAITIDVESGESVKAEAVQAELANGVSDSNATQGQVLLGNDDADEGGSETSTKTLLLDEVFEDAIQILHSNDAGTEREALFQFFLLLSVCHTVVIDYDENGDVSLNAESPDEEAFVKAAGVVGVSLEATGDGIIKVKTPDGFRSFKILAVNPFNSTRKRMSLVVNCLETNNILVMMKGADNVMIERLAEGQEEAAAALKAALERYSWSGLRTLVMGMRHMDEREYMEWEKLYKAALVAPPNQRAKAIADAAELIEGNVQLVGASAIEDQLQAGVPEAIQTLRDAGIQVWVLTGDKIETAINIGLSSNLLDSDMLQLKLISEDPTELNAQLDEILGVIGSALHLKKEEEQVHNIYPQQESLCRLREDVELKSDGGGSTGKSSLYQKCKAWILEKLFGYKLNDEVQANVALIISGLSLEYLLAKQKGSPEVEAKLLQVARFCKVVLACRVSPAQKSLVVEMVRFAPDNKKRLRAPVTLAIGDGANDVPMIQAAHVGVGISGQEGRQAVNSADFAIAQFRYLVRMMLVHGRWNYRRQANVILFISYSWLLYTFLLFIYLPFSLYSGQQIYYFTSYTSVFAYFANVVIVAHGWFDKDISAETALRNPWTYYIGLYSKELNYSKLTEIILRSIAHLLLIWGFVFSVVPLGISGEVLGTAVYLALVLVLFLLSLLYGTTFTSITVLVFMFMFALFLLFMGVTTTPSITFSQALGPAVWTGVLLALVAVMLIEMVVRYTKKEFFPRPLDLLIEQDRGYFKGEKHARASHQDAIKVLEEFGKLTVLPFSLGVKEIKKTVEEREEKHAAKEEEPPVLEHVGTSTSKPISSHAFSSTFQKLKPLFDVDMPDVGAGLSNTFKKVRQTFTHGEAKTKTSESEDEGIDEGKAMLSAATRLDLHEYIPQMTTIAENEVEEDDADETATLSDVEDEEEETEPQ